MRDVKLNIRGGCYGILLFSLLFIPVELVFSQDAPMLKFTDAINQVLDDNNGFAARVTGLEVKKKDIDIARAGFMPNLGFSASVFNAEGHEIVDRDMLGLSSEAKGVVSGNISQMIYDEKVFANHKIQKELYTSQEEQLRNTRYQMISSAGQVYISVLVAEEILEVLKIDRDLTRKNLDVAIYREEIGSTSQQEVLRWKTKLYKAEQNIESQKASVKVNRLALNQLRNRPVEQIDSLERLTVNNYGFIFASDIINRVAENETSAMILRDYLVELGLENSPLLGSIDAQIAAQDRQLRSNKRWLIPNLELVAGADDQYNVSNSNDQQSGTGAMFWFVGAQLNWNVFNGGANFSRLSQQKIQAQEIQFQRSEIMTAQEKAIRSGVSVLIADFKNLGLANEQAEVADQNYKMVYESYLLGEISLLNLLDAQEQKLVANYTAVMAHYTFMVDLLNVEQSIGFFPFLQSREEVDLIIQELESRILGG